MLHRCHNFSVTKQATIGIIEQHKTTCKDYCYVIAAEANWEPFSLVAHVRLYSERPTIIPYKR